eukprot:scaffold75890_cov17-Tisochrysis_lutea.AAC.1
MISGPAHHPPLSGTNASIGSSSRARGGRKGNADMQAAAEGHERDPNAMKERSAGGGRLEMKGAAASRSYGLAASLPAPSSSRGVRDGGPYRKRQEHTLLLEDDLVGERRQGHEEMQ